MNLSLRKTIPGLSRVSAGELRVAIQTAQRFGVYLGQRIIADDCIKRSAMLAYVTLLAIVPLMTIAFSVLTAFPVFEGMTDRLRGLMVEHLVPAASEVVDDHLESFVDRAAELTTVGIIGLAVSALLLLNNAERALNGIWGVSKPRPALQRIMVYWTVLTVGPLLIGAAIVVTPGISGYLLGPFGTGAVMLKNVAALGPFLVQAVIFALVYMLVPNRPVRASHAIAGGATAALLFELAKFGFARFVSGVPTYEAIYGALAALPIFLVWLYISWLVILLGAEIARALGSFPRCAESGVMGERWEMVLAVRLLGHLFAAQRRGEAMALSDLLALEPRSDEKNAERLLEELHSARIVDRNWAGKWVLIRDMSSFTLADMQRACSFRWPPLDAIGDNAQPENGQLEHSRLNGQLGNNQLGNSQLGNSQLGNSQLGRSAPVHPRLGDKRLAELLRPLEEQLDNALDVPLKELFEPSPAP